MLVSITEAGEAGGLPGLQSELCQEKGRGAEGYLSG